MRRTQKAFIIVSIISLIFLMFALSGCEKEGPAEKAGEKIDEAVEKAGDKIEEATDAVGEKVEKAGDQLDRKTN